MSQSLFEEFEALTTEDAIQRVVALPDEAAKDLLKRPWWFIGRPEQQEPEGVLVQSGWRSKYWLNPMLLTALLQSGQLSQRLSLILELCALRVLVGL